MNKNFYRNKTILITGASSGLGKAFAIILSSLQTNLILVARRKDNLLALKTDLEQNGTCSVHVVSEDLTNPSGPENVFTEVQQANLIVDVLINNAGFALSDEFLNYTIEQYSEMLDLNIKAMVKLIHLFVPSMIDRKSGAILNISSILGVIPTPDLSVYSGTKAFVLAFSESLWKELKRHKVRVTVLVSFGIETEFFNKVNRNKFRYLPMQKADIVAKKALSGLAKRKRIAYTGWRFSILIHCKRLLPQRIIIGLNDFLYNQNKNN